MTGRHAGRLGRRFATAAAVLLVLAACGQSTPALPNPDGDRPTSQARIAITPAAGSGDVAPDARVTVTSSGGLLRSVDVVDASGNYIGGDYSMDRSSWTSTYPMRTATAYTVQAAAADPAGLVATEAAQFATRTIPDDQRVSIRKVSPADGATAGVAHPLIVEFSRSVLNRAEVTKALRVETFPRVEGGWYWIDAATVDWRPKNLWPAGTQVSLHADLRSIDAGKGRYGSGVWTSSFTVGRSQVLNVDVTTHRMTVVRDGKVINSFPVSTGKPGWETRNGTKMIMEMVRGKTWTNEEIDAPEEYTEYSEYAMRVTNSGEFVHDASWNRRIGEGNASHGCMGLNPGDMAWLFDNSIVGDAVVVTGSPALHTDLWNRVQDWNVSWDRWLTGNYDLSDQ
ncbi:MAG: Ig-like domain-containing protein [Sporichthyaceae bacterium]